MYPILKILQNKKFKFCASPLKLANCHYLTLAQNWIEAVNGARHVQYR